MFQTLECFFTEKNRNWLCLTKEILSCNLPYVKNVREPEHQHSEHALLVCSKKIKETVKGIGCIPDILVKVVHRLMSE